ncbi:MAG: GNAT family N-acetyltransferase [Flavobacteriales bacterium]|nr:GNAT family N-acetyltransferase [Flavobacteriales bacterium]
MNSNLLIETNRLLIRPFTLNDIETSYLMNLDEEVSRFTGDGGVVSRKETERRIKEDVFGDYKKHGFGRMAVTLKSDNSFIGFSGLKFLENLKKVDLGYRLTKPHWGRGFATEAGWASLVYGFEKLKLQEIIAMVLPKNVKSIHVLNKLGFAHQSDFHQEHELVQVYQLSQEKYNSMNELFRVRINT